MAEPISPAGEPTAGDASVDGPTDTTRRRERPELLEPPTEEELAATGEPTLEEIHAAAGGTGTEVMPAADTEVIHASDTDVIRPAAAEETVAAEPEAARAAETEVVPASEPTAVQPVATAPAPPAPAAAPPPPPAPASAQPVLAPAEDSAPPPPRVRGNRLVGTAWVLLAAGLFQVLYFAALGLIILLLGGAAAVGPQITNIAKFPFAWLPVLFFFLFFELTVLLINRAGRFAYVVASLIVGLLVYISSVLLISIMVGGGIGDRSTLAQAFESPEFVLTGLVAREVMLWTGFAIGSRGIRVRRRNTEARKKYDEELADAQD